MKILSNLVESGSISIGGVHMEAQDYVILPSYKSISSSFILGQDFFRKNRFEVDVSNCKLISRHEDGSFIEFMFSESGALIGKNARVCCYASHDTLISQESTSLIHIDTLPMEDHDFVFDADQIDVKLKDRIIGYAGICDANTKRVLITTSGNDVHIKKGQLVGTLSTLLDEPNEEDHQSVTANHWTFQMIRELENLSHLDDNQRSEVHKLLYECSGALSAGDGDLGKAAVTKHHITLSNITPIYQRPRRFAAPLAEEIEKYCQELYLHDVIEPSQSPWNSPIVPVRKKDGSLRLCIDYRKLNQVTVPDKFPMPNLLDSIYGLRGIKYITSLDLVRAYHQIPLDEDSRPLTAFSTPRGHWQWKRLSFGLTNAPSSFQREIQATLSAFPSNRVIAYLDDILVMSESFEEHILLVTKVLKTLESYSLKIKPSKCHWFKPEVEYLGHVVNSEGIKKTPKFLNAISNYKRPSTVGELREFLGFINFQRKFLAHCSSIQKPLSSQTTGKKSKLLNWSVEMIEAFETLKTEMAKDVMLTYPDYTDRENPLELWVDASGFGTGAYLSQKQNGEQKVIAFASTCFTKQQMNYSTLERELTAIRWGVKTFRPFLYGVKFIMYTDHMPLLHLHNMKLVSSRLARTHQELADYNFDIRYVPGSKNTAADVLSRMSVILPVSYESDQAQRLPEGLILDGPAAPGGGDSLFVSLLRTLSRKNCKLPNTTIELREQIVDEMLNNSSRYNIKLDRDSRRDLKLMRHSGQLPSLELLLAVSYLYKVRLFVYFWHKDPIIYQFDNYEDEIFLQCLAAVHFNPLIDMKNFEMPNVNVCSVVRCNVNESSLSVNDVPRECDSDVLEPHEYNIDMSVLSNSNVKQCLYSNRKTCSHAQSQEPVIGIYINELLFCAILDSGSEISLISRGVINSINSDGTYCAIINDHVCDMVGLTGHKTSINESVLLDINVGERKYSHKFSIVSDDVVPYCMLIGKDFLDKFNISVDFNHNLVNADHMLLTTFLGESVPDNDNVFVLTKKSPAVSHEIHINNSIKDIRYEITGDEETVTGLSLVIGDNDVKKLQNKVSIIRRIKKYIIANIHFSEWTNKFNSWRNYSGNLVVKNDILYFSERGKLIPVVSRDVLTDLSLLMHIQFGHMGRDKLLHLISTLCWNPSRYKIINEICTTCSQCQLSKVSSPKVFPPTLKICTTFPFELVAIDLLSLPRTSKGNVALL